MTSWDWPATPLRLAPMPPTTPPNGSQGRGSSVDRMDLVVAATGRGSRAGQWLEAAGHERPVEERLQVDLMYVSCLLKMPSDALGPLRTVVTGPVPERPTAIALCVPENDTWILTVSGYAGPPCPRQTKGIP